MGAMIKTAYIEKVRHAFAVYAVQIPNIPNKK